MSKKKTEEKDQWPRCQRCGKKTSSIKHKCPLDGVLGPETGKLCNCCPECTNKCAMEV